MKISCPCARGGNGYHEAMKFFGAILAYIFIGAGLGWGILLAVRGDFWLLIAAVLVYLVAFAKIGCLPKKSH